MPGATPEKMTEKDRADLRTAVTKTRIAGFRHEGRERARDADRAGNRVPSREGAGFGSGGYEARPGHLPESCAFLAREKARPPGSFDTLHKATCTVSGAIGGFFGMYGLPVELPVSTAIMLRSIANIARSEGEGLHDIVDTKLSCLSVLALGARSSKDDNTEIGYFAVRAALAEALPRAAERAVPAALARFITLIAERFGNHRFCKSLPPKRCRYSGAVGGGAINLVFINHFQEVAHGHFTVRRLERMYGPEVVRAEYERERGNVRA